MAQAVNVDIRLKIVKREEIMIIKPAQNDSVKCWPSSRSFRTEAVIEDVLKRTPSSVDSKSDMNIMFEEYRCVMNSFKSFPLFMAQARCRLQMEKLSTVTKNSLILSKTRSDVHVLCEKSLLVSLEDVRCFNGIGRWEEFIDDESNLDGLQKFMFDNSSTVVA